MAKPLTPAKHAFRLFTMPTITEVENRELQSEECLALEAIYGEDVFYPDKDNEHAYIFKLDLDEQQDTMSPRTLVLRFYLPATYPSLDMPMYEILSIYCGNQRVDATLQKTIEDGFQELFQPNQVTLFEWINWLRDHLESQIERVHKVPQEAPKEGLKTAVEERAIKDEEITAISDSLASYTLQDNTMETRQRENVPNIYTSEPLVDRKSTFVAHIATVHSVDEVEAVMAKLMENKKIAKATHNIMAYRILLPNEQSLQDNDDDGETAAGGRLLHLLQIVDAQNVVVVVSRWYGGILLGADRFKDINNCARQALEICGYIKDETGGSKQKGKRKK